MKIIETAKAYRDKLGFSVIPINHEGSYEDRKKPYKNLSWSEFQDRHMTDGEIEKYFAGAKNIAVITGEISGIDVLDLDSYKNQFKDLEIKSSLSCKTPSGGEHLYFKHTPGLRPSVNNDMAIDIRADGSYVLLPPSENISSKYQWKIKPTKEMIDNLNTLPQNVLELVKTSGNSQFELSENINISKGARNDSLYKTACHLINKLSEDEAFALIEATNSNYDPPLSDREVMTVYKSALRFVKNNPPEMPLQTNSLITMPRVKKEHFKVYSGFETIDETLNGFRSSNTYLLGGYEKSGKSSLLAKLAINMMDQGNKIGIIHTELVEEEINTMFACIQRKVERNKVEDDDMGSRWRDEYSDRFYCMDQSSLMLETGEISYDLVIKSAKDFVEQGCKVIIFDNLTTFYNQATGGDNWQTLGSAIQKITNFSKLYGVISFVVVHQRPDTVYSETPRHIVKLIKANEEEQIFSDSVSIIEKPTNSKIYGGGAAHSQLSGSILVWRPLQNFDGDYYRSMAAVILENFRHAPPKTIRMIFTGSKSDFSEDPLSGFKENLN